MNFYTLLKIVNLRKIPDFAKFLGLAGLITLRRRIMAVYVDPVLSCNLRCKMCYFSDPAKRKEMHGIITPARVDELKRLMLPYAVKMQIGCGAEPTLYGDLEGLIKTGKEAKVPYISLTTNGQLIGSGKIDIDTLIEAGLDEITVSMHGTDRETYENLMPGGKFDNLLNLIDILARAKKKYPAFVIRVNFTINSLNLNNLKDDNFLLLWERRGVFPDIIQLRPVQNMGDTEWSDFDLSALKEQYQATILNTVEKAQKHNIRCLYPTPENLDQVDDVQDGAASAIEDLTYCYVSSGAFYKADFDPSRDTLFRYLKRTRAVRTLIRCAFLGPKRRQRNSSKKLNYRVN